MLFRIGREINPRYPCLVEQTAGTASTQPGGTRASTPQTAWERGLCGAAPVRAGCRLLGPPFLEEEEPQGKCTSKDIISASAFKACLQTSSGRAGPSCDRSAGAEGINPRAAFCSPRCSAQPMHSPHILIPELKPHINTKQCSSHQQRCPGAACSLR